MLCWPPLFLLPVCIRSIFPLLNFTCNSSNCSAIQPMSSGNLLSQCSPHFQAYVICRFHSLINNHQLYNQNNVNHLQNTSHTSIISHHRSVAFQLVRCILELSLCNSGGKYCMNQGKLVPTLHTVKAQAEWHESTITLHVTQSDWWDVGFQDGTKTPVNIAIMPNSNKLAPFVYVQA